MPPPNPTHEHARDPSATSHAPPPAGFDPRAEQALLKAFAARDPEAVETVGIRLGCVRRFLSAINHQHGGALSAEDLADAAQDTQLVVLRKIGDCHTDVPLEVWIWRVSYLEYRNAFRRKLRGRRRTVPDEAMQDAQQPAAAHQLEVREQILRGLAALPPAEAAIVQMKHFEGLTFEAISARLAESANTCKTRYYRAMDRLAQILRAAPGIRDP